MMKRLIAAFGVGAFALFSVDVKRDVAKRATEARLDSVAVSSVPPDFTLPDRQGKTYTLSQVAAENKLVLLNFWGAWCGPCRLEMPQFEKIYTDTAYAGLMILAVNEKDEPKDLEAYLAKRPLSFPILIDSGGGIAKRYGVRAYPTSLLIGSDGKVRQVIVGVESHLVAMIRQLLREKQKSE